MNNEQARPTSQPTPSAASGKEDYRRYIARKRRQRRKQRRLILCAAALLVLVLLIVLLVKGCSGSDPLTGTWDYDSNTTYQFDGKGSGAIPVSHPLAQRESVDPAEIVHEPQVVLNYNVGKSFKEWTTGAPADESVICTVDTAQAALDLVSAGIGIAFIPDSCVQQRPDIRFIPIRNWHQALYMCIYYDKWLEPPVWEFVELLVKSIRENTGEHSV